MAEEPKSDIARLEHAIRMLGGAISDVESTTEIGLAGNERVAKSLVDAVKHLDETTKITAAANERTARRLIWLTWALLIVTAAIAALTIALVVRGA